MEKSDLPEAPSQPELEPEFPRGRTLPKQSPLYWVDQKNRYLRQLMIRDIEAITGRPMIVYFTNCDTSAQIDSNDDKYFLELLGNGQKGPLDLFLETNGGMTDAAEKLVSTLTSQTTDLRVIVPRRAKSNGTLMALASKEIILGPGSELGPIDPNLVINNTQVPCQFILNLQNADPIAQQFAAYAVLQTTKLAKQLLKDGMMRGQPEQSIDEVITKLSTRDHYHSHGSVIDAREAMGLGLNVKILDAADEQWQRYWLLRCMYEADARAAGVIKIFESSRLSNAIRAI